MENELTKKEEMIMTLILIVGLIGVVIGGVLMALGDPVML